MPKNPVHAYPDSHSENWTKIIITLFFLITVVVSVVLVLLGFKYDSNELKIILERIIFYSAIYLAGIGTPSTIKKSLDCINNLMKG